MSEPRVDADAFNAFEAAGWEKQVSGYQDFFGPITTRLVCPLLEAAAVDRGARVLDVASGPGYVAAAAAERGASVIGVDIAEGMISLARRLQPQLDFRFGNAEALPFSDASFDAVVANFVLLHLGRPERAAAEFARVLDADGRVALTVWDLPDQARFLGVLVDAIAEAGASSPQDIPVGPPIFRFSDEREFTSLLRDQGLHDIDVRTISFSHAHRQAVRGRRRAGTSGVREACLRPQAAVARAPDFESSRHRRSRTLLAPGSASGTGVGDDFRVPCKAAVSTVLRERDIAYSRSPAASRA